MGTHDVKHGEDVQAFVFVGYGSVRGEEDHVLLFFPFPAQPAFG